MALRMIQTTTGLVLSFQSYPSYKKASSWLSNDVLVSHNALHSTQSGFRPNHSCNTALQMINEFHKAINNGQMISMVMVNFSKAFDLVDHTLLIEKKLRHYKISNKTILWFSSNLLNTKQKGVINDIESKYEKNIFGPSRLNFWTSVIFNVHKWIASLYGKCLHRS